MAVWFLGTVLVFALVGQRTAKVFRRFPPLAAYSLDVGGSCAGIVAFMAVSALQLPAWSWFLATVENVIPIARLAAMKTNAAASSSPRLPTIGT